MFKHFAHLLSTSYAPLVSLQALYHSSQPNKLGVQP